MRSRPDLLRQYGYSAALGVSPSVAASQGGDVLWLLRNPGPAEGSLIENLTSPTSISWGYANATYINDELPVSVFEVTCAWAQFDGYASALGSGEGWQAQGAVSVGWALYAGPYNNFYGAAATAPFHHRPGPGLRMLAQGAPGSRVPVTAVLQPGEGIGVLGWCRGLRHSLADTQWRGLMTVNVIGETLT